MRNRDLGEARRARQLREPQLVGRIAVSVHQHDCGRAVAAPVRIQEIAARLLLVERLEHFAVRGHALEHLIHRAVERLRQHDMAVEEPRAILVADLQLVAEAARDE
jgi:hypothetical protein